MTGGDTADGDAGQEGTWPAGDDDFAVISVLRVRLDAVAANRRSVLRRSGLDVQDSVAVDQQAVRVPAPQARELAAPCQMPSAAGGTSGAHERLIAAIAENTAERTDYLFGPVRVRGLRRNAVDPAAVSDVLDRCRRLLDDLAARSLGSMAARAGAAPMAAGMAGSIGADLILIPVIRQEENAVSFIDIFAIGFGLVTGHPHVAAAALHHLLRTQAHMAIERQVSRALGDVPALGRPGPSLPGSRANPGTRDRGTSSAARAAPDTRLWSQTARGPAARIKASGRPAPARRQPDNSDGRKPPAAAPPAARRRAPGTDPPRRSGRER